MQELNFEALNQFCSAWIRKSERIDLEPLEGVFDRFFTLWVVYNRLYEEAGRYLVHRQHPFYRPFIARRGRRVYAPPPDKISATKGIVAYVGMGYLRENVFANQNAVEGMNFVNDAVQNGMLYLHEDYETGEPDIERDQELVTKAREGCVESILTLIYQARCNLFHGQKSFTESQRDLLNGMSEILRVIISCSLTEIEERAGNA
ncbi:hypothetical protein [Shewanella algidipiscicola]|uniref:hypothetical protein n=1 Tax=Shewanella algidipiscicola TaxID=614070 RepID=UPI000D7847F2|nr:hypothetical protein [Shewanella algidipiscicola]